MVKSTHLLRIELFREHALFWKLSGGLALPAWSSSISELEDQERLFREWFQFDSDMEA